MGLRSWWRRSAGPIYGGPEIGRIPRGEPDQILTPEEARLVGITVPDGATAFHIYGGRFNVPPHDPGLDAAMAVAEKWELSRIHDVSEFFELSYAHYLTVPRSIMEAMPLEWQQRIVRCLRELDETFDWRPKNARYYCFLRKGNGHFGEDPLHEYRHPSLSYIESLRK